ncbi:MAG: HNH endonuclease [Deltaproteobacteria bacterium CG12_big_fil_rev_8_21_14_0_65_43_10]|nr:MAG: HNH endonuclease [Deltaproteobacteria bacterium CG12_big_fil_rev_8_21_14_0_65_43_10]PIU85413.1 MAG: HNH endonuclease [Deltaproteobacteria bacterium CG06_land_8_20_14_3_00_44_19]
MSRKPGSKQLILEFFLQNIGNVLESKDIQKASGGAVEWARRVRELRNEDGYQILSHKDRASLKPNQYVMETIERVPAFTRGISKETRAWVLERNGYTCQMCGVAAGDPDPFGGNRTVRLTIGHIIDKSKGGEDTPHNLRAVCTNCNEGLQNTSLPKPDRIHLLAQIRRATIQDQEAVLDWLLQKFNLEAKNKK